MAGLRLTRTRGEVVFIDKKLIKVTVSDICQGLVELTIEAPPEISIHREEVYKRIEAEKANRQFRQENSSFDAQLRRVMAQSFKNHNHYTTIN